MLQPRVPVDYPRRTFIPVASWLPKALCRTENNDPRWWYPVRSGNEYAQRALVVCAKCPVREDCLEHALETEERHGIWGGMTERQRAREIKRRERARAQRGF